MPKKPRAARQPHSNEPPTGAVHHPNWTLLGVLAIVALVAIVGLVRPDKVGIEYDKGRVNGTAETHNPVERR